MTALLLRIAMIVLPVLAVLVVVIVVISAVDRLRDNDDDTAELKRRMGPRP